MLWELFCIVTSVDDDDFIPIEDLPSEKIELPTELFGKFEATKTESAQTAPEQPSHPCLLYTSRCV